MNLFFFVALAAVVLSVSAAPRKQQLLTSTKDYGATLVRVPYPVVRSGTPNCGGNSPPSPPTTEPPTTSSTVATTATGSAPRSVPPRDGPPTGRGSCASCSMDNFDLVNQYRAANGLNTLGWSQTLSDLADQWSKTMYDTKVFKHSDFNYWENIIFGSGLYTWDNVAQEFFTGWQNSDGHDRNMKLSSHQCMGVGVYGDGNTFYGTQIFSNDCP